MRQQQQQRQHVAAAAAAAGLGADEADVRVPDSGSKQQQQHVAAAAAAGQGAEACGWRQQAVAAATSCFGLKGADLRAPE
jgi:hypothetical protein